MKVVNTFVVFKDSISANSKKMTKHKKDLNIIQNARHNVWIGLVTARSNETNIKFVYGNTMAI